ncbi:methionine gamma-lyase [Planctomycetota bacterium]|nr:methionine gamma-lyase [Planctomycetota bacterium]
MNEPLYGTQNAHCTPLGPLSAPLHRATTVAQPDAETVRLLGTGQRKGEFYQRVGHPNCWQFESLAAAREGADGAVAFGSGMAAMSAAILAHVRAFDRVLIAQEIYGGTSAFALQDLVRFGVTVDRFSSLDLASLKTALNKPTALVVFESPINPTLRVADIDAIVALARAAKAKTIFDGTFAPPPIQRALDQGVDMVVHSATKFYGGHSDVLAGFVAGAHASLLPIEAFRRRTGGILAPDPAWLLLRSFATLDLRIAAAQSAAAEIALGLRAEVASGRLQTVIYPGAADHPDRALVLRQMGGGGTMLSFVVPGGLIGAKAVFNRFEVIARAPSLGSVESLASLPAYSTHAPLTPQQRNEAGIEDGLLRIAVGLEGAPRLLADIRHSLG